ncbi:MAG: hypothetical protein H6722_06095 [Sandaracinus sp.]|nr:hypothetical protein [Sandaracinus sp.]
MLRFFSGACRRFAVFLLACVSTSAAAQDAQSETQASAEIDVSDLVSPRVETLPAAGPARPSGGDQNGPAPVPEPPPRRRRDPSPEGGWRAFGGQTFFLLGGTLAAGVAALGADGDTMGPLALSVLVYTGGGAALFGSLARRKEWSPRLGDALAGVYPGAAVGALVGGLVAAGADRRLGRGLGWGALGGAMITSWLFSRLANALDGGPERPGRGGRFVGLMWVYMLAAGLLSIPAAVVTNRGEIVTAAAAAGGLAGLVHVALAPRLRF